ncbi:hypothetical protein [Pseudotabrizicola sp.]|uniref:hypothetical protein n=1 Tax=Pseudotabrizicola sp. TaxID=2939647 RepID=UPI00271B4A89|nr:hypothetical protein [Pseudotabrizicola sp.]MDO8883328.1 hypothetical protein [Pseudotabrizicola sp.]
MVGAIVFGACAGLALGRGTSAPLGGHVMMPVSAFWVLPFMTRSLPAPSEIWATLR